MAFGKSKEPKIEFDLDEFKHLVSRAENAVETLNTQLKVLKNVGIDLAKVSENLRKSTDRLR